MTDATQHRYTAVAIAMHWLIAFGIIGMIGLGWYMGDLEDRAQQYALTQLHKSLGIVILLLSAARIIWRVMNPQPPEPEMPAWQSSAARATHIAFYVLIIAMPLTGWLMVSASTTGIPTNLFGAIPWPHIPGLPNLSTEAKEAFHVPIEFAHSKLAWVAIVLLVLHVGAALKHQFVDKDGLLARMIPGVFGKTAGPAQPGRGLLTTFGAVAAGFALIVAIPILFGKAEPQPMTGSIAIPATTEEAETITDPAPTPAPEPQAPTPAAPAAVEEPAQTEPAPETPAQATPTAEPEPAPPPPAPIPTWAVDGSSSELGFTAAYMGREFSGKFDDWTADIAFDPDRPAEANIRVTITMSSVNTGEPFYDENVVLGDWFDASNHPTAVFTAQSASAQGDDRFRADGTLTIKNNTQPLPLDFSLSIAGDQAEVQGEATLQRLAFAIGADTLTEPRGDEDWVANDVKVTFNLNATRN